MTTVPLPTLPWTHVDMEKVTGSENPNEDLFLIDGLLSTSATVISGRSESGKTNLTSHIAHALLTGESFLGREVRGGPHRVFWLGGDPSWARELDNSIAKGVQNWFRMDDSNPLILRLKSNDSGELTSTWIDFGHYLVAEGVSVLVVDSATAYVGQYGLDKIQEVQPFLNVLTHITGLGIAVILIAHSPKGGREGHRSAGKPGGSEAIIAWRRVGIEVHGDGTVTENRKVTVMGNRVPQTEFVFRTLSSTEYELRSAKDKMRKVAKEESPEEESHSSRKRKLDPMQVRAHALLGAPQEARRNQSAAGEWLAVNDPCGGVKSADAGRTTSGRMVKAQVLLQETSGRLIAGPNLRSESVPA